jgi:glyoxylase-like metal-dependent hydrolase (beta-lactamase superfamily II)
MMNFVYLIGCTETREAAVVDPAWDVPAILELARKSDLRITRILLTHGHPDHMNGLEALLDATDAKICLHAQETDYLKEVAAFFGMPIDFMGRRESSFQAVSDGDTIIIGKLPVRVLHTPGHTPGSQCFLVDGNLVSGDTLFVNACGRVDMPGGDPEAMWHSLTRKLAALDDETILYPGHNYGTRSTATMGEQKRDNPYLRFTSLDAFVRDMKEP